nr:hypothetical protein [Pseudonocardia broussonetiae]
MGLPSYVTAVTPESRLETTLFHSIQLVVVYQKKVSPGPRSFCSAVEARLIATTPPWPCTIPFGTPVVPEENRTHSGWSAGTCSVTSSAVESGEQTSPQRSWGTGPKAPGPTSSPGRDTVTTARTPSSSTSAATSVRRSCTFPAKAYAVAATSTAGSSCRSLPAAAGTP